MAGSREERGWLQVQTRAIVCGDGINKWRVDSRRLVVLNDWVWVGIGGGGGRESDGTAW